jgi:hypothetical protein
MSPELTGVVCDRIHSERLLSIEAATNPEFLESLLADPRAAVDYLLNGRLPQDVEIEIVEMAPDRLRVTIPPRAAIEGQLADEELQGVAGGIPGAGVLERMSGLNAQLFSLQDGPRLGGRLRVTPEAP